MHSSLCITVSLAFLPLFSILEVMERKKGFTLVEILVAMLIVAILATIGISTFTSSQKKGRDSKRKTDLAQLQRALEAYINDYNSYPQSDAAGKIIGCGDNDTACQWGEAFMNTVNDTVYLAALPKDTTPAQQYYYEFVEPNGYRIYGRLENTSDPAIPPTGQYSTICGSGSTKYCNYVITSENVAAPSGYVLPTNTPTITSTPTSSPTPTEPPCKSNGATCTLASECCSGACNSFYQDQDGDGYGAGSVVNLCGTSASGYVTNNTDCYDQNANARPGSTYCGTVNRGDGSFDYNCNGTQSTCGTMYYIVSGCGCLSGECSGSCRGYTGRTPVGCGATGNISAWTNVQWRARQSGYGSDCVTRDCWAYNKGAAGTQGCQ